MFSRSRCRISGDAIPLMKESRPSSSRYCSAVKKIEIAVLAEFPKFLEEFSESFTWFLSSGCK